MEQTNLPIEKKKLIFKKETIAVFMHDVASRGVLADYTRNANDPKCQTNGCASTIELECNVRRTI